MKYLKRLPNSKDKDNKNNKRQYFIINRNQNNTNILLMPKYMQKYITEFNYLFDQIYQCAEANLVDDSNYHIFYSFGNNVRKFLEVLLFYKYPCNIDNDAHTKRLKQYFDDTQVSSEIERMGNEYSHLEEIFTRSESIIDGNNIEMQKIAKFILRKMEEKDKEQYDAILESVTKNN